MHRLVFLIVLVLSSSSVAQTLDATPLPPPVCDSAAKLQQVTLRCPGDGVKATTVIAGTPSGEIVTPTNVGFNSVILMCKAKGDTTNPPPSDRVLQIPPYRAATVWGCDPDGPYPEMMAACTTTSEVAAADAKLAYCTPNFYK